MIRLVQYFSSECNIFLYHIQRQSILYKYGDVEPYNISFYFSDKVTHNFYHRLLITKYTGIDDGHNIEQEMLSGIYDRVKKIPFIPGEDHTTTVQKVEQSIVGNRPVSQIQMISDSFMTS